MGWTLLHFVRGTGNQAHPKSHGLDTTTFRTGNGEPSPPQIPWRGHYYISYGERGTKPPPNPMGWTLLHFVRGTGNQAHPKSHGVDTTTFRTGNGEPSPPQILWRGHYYISYGERGTKPTPNPMAWTLLHFVRGTGNQAHPKSH